MSRAFVKEAEDGDTFDDVGERPISPYPNDVTPEGLALIEEALVRAHREHAEAQARNDRRALAEAARDLRYWNARRASAQVIPPPVDKEHVHFGSTVTLLRDDGRTQTYRIVGEDEADVAKGKLSHAAPLARALFGKKVGETATVGGNEIEIVEIA
jgi:transcription elongation GreA/GreB family factor